MRMKPWLVFVVPGGLVIVLIVFVLALLLVKLLWSWTVPDLFPRAVTEGYVSGWISWFTALKLAIFIALLAGVAGARGRQRTVTRKEVHYDARP